MKPVIKTSRLFFVFFLSHFFDSWIRRGIHIPVSSKKLLYLQYGKAPSNIDFVPTPEIAAIPVFFKPRDSPRFVFQFARAAAITSSVKTHETYEIELWWLLLLADIFRQQNVGVSKCDRFCPGNFIVWSLDIAPFSRFFGHISSLRDVTVTREI